MQKLKEEFEQNGGTWKEFKLSELFKSQNGDFDIQQKHIDNIGEVVVSSGVQNNGIIGKSSVKAKIVRGNTITIDMFGNAFFRDFPYKMVTHARVFSLSSECLKHNKCGLYIVALLGYLPHLFSYSNMASWAKIKDFKIRLPVNKLANIAFDYMERYISELEEERISELAAYLKVTGLENCVLTKPEKLALKSRGGGNLRKFKIVDLFTVKNTHSILNSWIVPNSGVYPYVTAGESNNSILTYINYDSTQLEDENAILIGGKTTVITYQEKEFFSNDSHNLALYLKDSSNVSKNVSLFLIASLSKALKPIYSWGNSISKRKIQKDYISLPATQTGTPDYELMETYIRALEKVVIKGVVDWKDRIIKTTKEIVYSK